MAHSEYGLSEYDNRHNFGTEDNTWTTARCNRLLRSINSRIIALRRAVSTARKIQTSIPVTRPKKRKAADDPAWVPEAKHKKTTKTYSAKSNLRPAPRKEAKIKRSHIALPSPFARRVQLFDDEVLTESRAMAMKPRGNRRKQLPVIPSSPTDKAEQQLTSAFDVLLRSTLAHDPTTTRALGCRSLMSTCLRRVPNLLDMDDAEFMFGDTDDGADHIFDLYTYLEEEYEVATGQGVPQLRLVVRQHAVRLVRGAITEGIVSDSTVEQLLNICASRTSVHEEELLLRAWFSILPDITRMHISCLKRVCEKQGNRSPFIRVLSDLLDDGNLGLALKLTQEHEKLCSFIPTCLEGQAHRRGLSEHSFKDRIPLETPSYEAAELLQRFVMLNANKLATLDQQIQAAAAYEDLQNTAMTMALVALCDTLAVDKTSWHSGIVHETLLRIAGCLIHSPESQKRLQNDAAPSSKAKPVDERPLPDCRLPYLMAAFLVLATTANGMSEFGVLNLDSIARSIIALAPIPSGSQHGLTKDATDFIHAFSRSVLAIDSIRGADLSERLLIRLLANAKLQKHTTSRLLTTFAMEITTQNSSAASTATQKDLTANVNAILDMQDQDNKENATGQSDKRFNYRWDDGLCEWVTATPRAHAVVAPLSPVSVMEPSIQDERVLFSPDVLAPSPVFVRRSKSNRGNDRKAMKNTGGFREKITNKRRGSTKSTVVDQDWSGDELGF